MEIFVQEASFGSALSSLRMGHRIARLGWNGKGMYLELVSCIHSIKEGGTSQPVYRLTGTECDTEGLPWIGMKTADNKFVPWLASQTDILAFDWVVYKKVS